MTLTLRRKPKYERRPRLKLDRRARLALSRKRRWQRRNGSAHGGKASLGIAALAVAAVFWIAWRPAPLSLPPAPVFPEFVAQAEAAFPEALRGHTRATGGRLADGREVPVALTLLLPGHALDSASASSDALDRLSAPFVGQERAIAGTEMGARLAALADVALPKEVSRCYTYEAGTPRRIALPNRTIRAVPLEIAFNPGC